MCKRCHTIPYLNDKTETPSETVLVSEQGKLLGLDSPIDDDKDQDYKSSIGDDDDTKG